LKRIRYSWFIALVILSTISTQAVNAQNGPPQYVRDAVAAVENMLQSEGDAPIEAFVRTAMTPDAASDQSDLMNRLRAIRDAVRGLQDDLSVEAEPDGVRLILSSDETEKQIKVALGPDGISDLYLMEDAPERLVLTRDNLSETFDQLAAEGMAGVVYVRLGGEVVLQRAFGLANPESKTPNTLDTIFGTGSRPIDYTVAAVYLLDQKGQIHLDDPIDRYFDNVPPDKRSMTIRHLMTGQSGLPDFFHTATDWDPDLAWIDRKTAEQRILSQALLFAPGAGHKHSHGAFVLLAALVERVSGKSYYDFIRENFLDPAGMNRTGEYGEMRGLALDDFAAGSGPQIVGLPNIPPNWGPTSWLIKGSGGMYATLGDLMKFYTFIRSGAVLDAQHRIAFSRPVVNVDGSDRGFELFSAYDPSGDQIYLFLNAPGDRSRLRGLFRALESLVGSGDN